MPRLRPVPAAMSHLQGCRQGHSAHVSFVKKVPNYVYAFELMGSTYCDFDFCVVGFLKMFYLLQLKAVLCKYINMRLNPRALCAGTALRARNWLRISPAESDLSEASGF